MNQGAATADINLMQQFRLLLTGLMVLFVLGWVSEEDQSMMNARQPAKASMLSLKALNAEVGARVSRNALPPMPCVIDRQGGASGVRET